MSLKLQITVRQGRRVWFISVDKDYGEGTKNDSLIFTSFFPLYFLTKFPNAYVFGDTIK